MISIIIGGLTLFIRLLISDYKSSYNELIYDWRKQKDEYFKTSPESPIENKEEFEGLSYFAPSRTFVTKAKLALLHDSSYFVIKRNDGKKVPYFQYAIASFKLKKKEYNLILLKPIGEAAKNAPYFIPFSDKSSGEQTFGGGRYIDIELIDSTKAEIDFNKAYNPYCAYNSRFACPLPPKQNHLDIEILAGEKTFEKTASKDKD